MADNLSATRLKRGMIIKQDGELLRILELEHKTPGNLRGFVRIKVRNLRNRRHVGAAAALGRLGRAGGARREADAVPLQRREGHHFMDTESYEQTRLTDEALGDSVGFLKPEMTISVEFYGAEPVGIELPPTVDMKIVATVPAIKGATATNQLKPATTETGMVVHVPPFIGEGDVIRVSTETGEYQSRA